MTDQLLHSIPTCPGNNSPLLFAFGNEEIYLIGSWQKRVYALGPNTITVGLPRLVILDGGIGRNPNVLPGLFMKGVKEVLLCSVVLTKRLQLQQMKSVVQWVVGIGEPGKPRPIVQKKCKAGDRSGMIQGLFRKHGHVRQTRFILRSRHNERISVWNHRNIGTLDRMDLKKVGQDKPRGIVIVLPGRNPDTGKWIIPLMVADFPKIVARSIEGFFKAAAPIRKMPLLNLY